MAPTTTAPALLVAALCASAAHRAQTPDRVVTAEQLPDYAKLVGAAKTAARRGETQRALRLLELAVAKDRDRYEAYAVAAYALYRSGDDARGDDALARAVERAPREAREALGRLRAQIAEATSEAAFQRHLEAGYLALSRNLPAKAAAELLAAFELRPDRPELALEAATALVAIQEWGQARAVLRSVAAQPEATEMLAYLDPIVTAAYREQVEVARAALERDTTAARAALDEAFAAAPEQPDAYLLLARVELRAAAPDAAVTALRAAVERGWLDRKGLLDDAELRALADHPGFRALVHDAFGDRGLARLAQPLDVPEDVAAAVEITNSAGMQLRLVAAGRFAMGSPPGEHGRDARCEQQHEVALTRSFYLGVTEVTQEQWREVMSSNPSVRIGGDLPVHRVSWFDANEFCRRLTDREKVVYRLPTEAEWEYACRAGSVGAFSFGEDAAGLGEVAWFKGSAQAQPVATRAANPWGLHDVHGNVYEWCADFFAPYSSDAATDPTGPPAGTLRVARGGAFTSSAHTTRSAHRARYAPDLLAPHVGFRILREVTSR